MPVYRGKVPDELILAQKMTNPTDAQKPRLVFKRLVESGKIHQMSTMQIVTQVSDLNPPDDQPELEFNPIPSMLHHIEKSDLEQYSLETIFSRYDQENDEFFEQERFAPQLTHVSKFKTTADVIQGAVNAFKNHYMR